MPHELGDTIVITRKKIKHLYLRIDRNGLLQVSAPRHMPEKQIMAFIEEKKDWILLKQKKLQKHTTSKPSNNADILPFLGQELTIKRIAGSQNNIVTTKEKCLITLKQRNLKLEEKLITEYYRTQIRPILDKFVTHYRPIIGVIPSEVRTKNMKTKWGTCNTYAKRLWFNVQLARFSEKHIEYVVVHEMVHLLERSHNARFYNLVEQAMPDWKTYHEELKHSR